MVREAYSKTVNFGIYFQYSNFGVCNKRSHDVACGEISMHQLCFAMNVVHATCHLAAKLNEIAYFEGLAKQVSVVWCNVACMKRRFTDFHC